MGSPSSADLPAGTLIAGFRLERVIGRGPRATVYEAEQLSLDRRVAFKLFDDPGLAARVRQLEWPEHPGAVSLFGTGDSEHGPWLAMRLVPGGARLATRRARLDTVAAALDHAHAQGIVHGNLTAGNVLVDGERAYVSDFGLGPEDATAEDDRTAFATLVREHPPPASHRRPALIALAVGAVAALTLFVVLATRGDGDGASEAAVAPPVPAGTRAVGSLLAPGGVQSVDCNGMAPSGASPACTMGQRTLAGKPVVVPIDGTITSWAVRGALGSLALQVLRESGPGGRRIQIVRSADEAILGPDVHVAKAALPVAAGDRVALEVAPGAAVGVRRGGPRASIDRWFGPLIDPPRLPERPAGTGFDHELLLRVGVAPRRGDDALDQLGGQAAASAPPGRVLVTRDIDAGDVRLTTSIVVLGRELALDVFDGKRRIVRASFPRAREPGRVVDTAGGDGFLRLRWRNPNGEEIDRTVELGR